MSVVSSVVSVMQHELADMHSLHPLSLSERVASALMDAEHVASADAPPEEDADNPFLWQFIEWMFYGEPEETGMETLEPHV
jgi:hypothetical protein